MIWAKDKSPLQLSMGHIDRFCGFLPEIKKTLGYLEIKKKVFSFVPENAIQLIN
ncbi:MAG: hypothetical protein LBH06_09555 [Rikenellaceae bacterium]|jgi:hypothetical protein|nr:hypothetical protein [Rikenellaceae bacterium]